MLREEEKLTTPLKLYLEAGLHKLGDPGWTQGGASLLKYWQAAAAVPEAPARPAISYEWYRDFINLLINNHTEGWFAWLITLGEIAVGVGLILGALVGIAAFFGALMSMSFLLAVGLFDPVSSRGLG
jgi:thiosulfate dehydrogenase [quinone] large subunit